MVDTLSTMKTNQRTIKVYDTTHRLASSLSNKFGVSMTALLELAVRELSKKPVLQLHARPIPGRKMNARRALA